MSDAAFLDAILAHPDDDGPRLVYADWLDEQGQAARAEFIRVQCELARLGEADPRRLARELCLVMEGAYVTRQVTGDKQSIDVARRVADLVIAAHLPETDCGAPEG